MTGLKRHVTSLGKLNFSRSVLVGVTASVCDISTLVTLVKLLHFPPKYANIPSLLVGSSIQFFGNRKFVFKAEGDSLTKQIPRYVATESVGFCLNASIYYLLITFTSINFAAARPIGSFLVFACYSYPMWKRVVFKKTASESRNGPESRRRPESGQ